jgi:hypothetical protein
MSNEITVTGLLRVIKDASDLQRQTGTLQIDQTGKGYNIQNITATTSNQNLTKGGVGDCGWCYMRNLGAAGEPNVIITFDNGTTEAMTLEPGEPALLRLTAAAVVSAFTVKASATTVDFEFTVIED